MEGFKSETGPGPGDDEESVALLRVLGVGRCLQTALSTLKAGEVTEQAPREGGFPSCGQKSCREGAT
jgi:hypothetical protein